MSWTIVRISNVGGEHFVIVFIFSPFLPKEGSAYIYMPTTSRETNNSPYLVPDLVSNKHVKLIDLLNDVNE